MLYILRLKSLAHTTLTHWLCAYLLSSSSNDHLPYIPGAPSEGRTMPGGIALKSLSKTGVFLKQSAVQNSMLDQGFRWEIKRDSLEELSDNCRALSLTQRSPFYIKFRTKVIQRDKTRTKLFHKQNNQPWRLGKKGQVPKKKDPNTFKPLNKDCDSSYALRTLQLITASQQLLHSPRPIASTLPSFGSKNAQSPPWPHTSPTEAKKMTLVNVTLSTVPQPVSHPQKAHCHDMDFYFSITL